MHVLFSTPQVILSTRPVHDAKGLPFQAALSKQVIIRSLTRQAEIIQLYVVFHPCQAKTHVHV